MYSSSAWFQACRSAAPEANPVALDSIAGRYVTLALGLGAHDRNYVDAYYGPDSLKAKAKAESLSVAEIRRHADSLIGVLGDTVPAYADSMVRMRHRYLRTQLGSLSARAGMLNGRKLGFDEEAKALYDVTPPHLGDAHFDSLLARLDSLLPGKAPLAVRFQQFRDRMVIPAGRVDTVFKTAIAACRARTRAHMQLPDGERFDLEYVKGTPWNAYNWYKGNFHSLIQVNLDFPIQIDRAVDLACHEGYPGSPRLQCQSGKGVVSRSRLGGDLGLSVVQSPVAHCRGQCQFRNRHGILAVGTGGVRA